MAMEMYRAEIVGSLLLPAYMKRARLDLAAARPSIRQFKQVAIWVSLPYFSRRYNA